MFMADKHNVLRHRSNLSQVVFCFISLILLLLILPLCATPGALAEEPLLFQTRIQPLLAEMCGKCHGEKKQQGGLRLDTALGLVRGGDSGPAVVAGGAEESLLYQLVRSGEMPPKGNQRLTDEQIELIAQWLSQGAKVGDHAVDRPSVTDQQIVPLMLLRCSPCHGGRRKEAGLDLRTKDSMLRGGKSGPAIALGKPLDSLIVKRIECGDMPPRRQLVSVSIKPMEDSELELLKAWIAVGAPTWKPSDNDQGAKHKEASDDVRRFWSFRPLTRPNPPPAQSLSAHDRIRNRIDEFILDKLTQQNLNFSPEADKSVLYRRVHFDLVGLPPEPEDVKEFVDDRHPQAYEELVERLLASPGHGERWGRHWLDVAGYADSEGAQNEDRVRPDMWRYRDYVIRAMNSDKPYDRFLHEQLAGDELSEFTSDEGVSDEIYDNLVATGFLRTAPDRTFANITNFVPDRLEVIADEIQILGSAVLGLTLHCARCHAHKFDPISQADYYGLAALLKDALDEHDWLGPEQRTLKSVTTAERQAWLQHEQAISMELTPLKDQLKTETDAEAKKRLESRIKEIESRRQAEPKIRALWGRGDPSPTFLLKRGNYLTPGPVVAPGIPTIFASSAHDFRIEPPWPNAKSTGRRLALARWLTRPDHPLSARVIVNRIWKQHFGIGIVSTLSNFGVTGALPTHPELLDWLASELVRHDWSQKAIHRLILNSTTYRQSSLVTRQHLSSDPDNRLLSRMPLRRLEAEIVRDSLLFVAGRLNGAPFGPPDAVDVRADGLVSSKDFAEGGRRSVYVLHRRTKLPTLLENFDSPQMGPNCVERGESNVAPQALHLLNNAAIQNLAKHFAQRVIRLTGEDSQNWIIQAHALAFGTASSNDELELARQGFAELVEQWRQELPAESDRQIRVRALESYCHALINSAAFLYVD